MSDRHEPTATSSAVPGRGSRRLIAGMLAAWLLAMAMPVQAAKLDTVRLRAGLTDADSEVEGGALALTWDARSPLPGLGWIGGDMHYEAALSGWSNAGPGGDTVYTAHFGPAWRFRPALLGSRGFIEAGTSIAHVSARRVVGKDLGSRWHFTTHATLGLDLGRDRRTHLGLRIRHSSNAGFSSPNPGLDIVMLELGFRL
ncbi:MAG: acyloxyacyl hydrolase [Halofilum sp. (in: g-proteobacteria)]|nr:acyloxyacyl hydrolase [Halofilum sp. (in: g-proteobacteria)]